MYQTSKSGKGMLERLNEDLQALKDESMFRTLPEVMVQGRFVVAKDGRKMLNLSSNDYLSIGCNETLKQEFFASNSPAAFSSCSSRLMSGFDAHTCRLESTLAALYSKPAAVVFNSGYHANTSILPAISTPRTLIVADKLVHASLIDGILLSKCDFVRFAHNNLEKLASILESKHSKYDEVIVVSESTFSMDGDVCDLRALAELKHCYNNVYLYIDCAHDLAAVGERGLGEAERQGVVEDIDLLVATFGKAVASYGAFCVCSQVVKDYLVNKARGFIFSTALSPLQMQWTGFVIDKLADLSCQRKKLQNNVSYFLGRLKEKGLQTPSVSHIVPIIVGSSEQAVKKAGLLAEHGFYCLAVRPPTVPQNSCRLRLSLNSEMSFSELDNLLDIL